MTPALRPALRKRVVLETPRGADRLLLDTRVWLWWQADDDRLGQQTRRAIAEAPEVWFSAASAWEIGIKAALGKLSLPKRADITSELHRDGFRSLSISVEHASTAAALPTIHRDPFDRLLIAQASLEGLTLVSADTIMKRYGIPTLHATS